MSNDPDMCWNQLGVGGDASCVRLAKVGHCRNCEQYVHAGRTLLDREASDSLRRQWLQLLAESKPAAAAHGESVVVFEVCGEYVALRALLLECVKEMRVVHTVPSRSGSVFTGLVNVDGELLPCFSVAAALQLGEGNPLPNPRRMLILRHGEARLACAVDQVVGFVLLSAGELETPPVTLARNDRAFTTAVFSVKGKVAGLLDGDKLFGRLMKSAGV